PSGVTSIGPYAFSGCKSLTTLEIPKGVTKIGEKAFNSCTSLTLSVHEESYGLTYAKENSLAYTMISKVREVLASGEIGGVIWEFDNFNVLTVKGEGAIPNYTRTETAPWYEYRKKIVSIIIDDGVTGIGDYAFYNLAKATEMSIADSVDYLGVQFIRGTGITELSVNARTISANAFGRADNLVTLTIGEGFENALGNIFYSETLTVKAPENSYAYKYLEYYNERYPDSQASITLEADGVAKNKVARFGYMGDNAFYAMYENAKGNWKMVISGTGAMKNFPYICDKNKAKGYTFCPTYYMVEEGVETKILSLEVLDGITTIGNCAFYKCTKATSVVIPDSVTAIGQNAFWVCPRLKTITLPESVTKISKYAFNGCTSLTSINIPDGVETLGEDIFIKCKADGLSVETGNLATVRYVINNYPEITIIEPEIPVEPVIECIDYKIVATENYGLYYYTEGIRAAKTNEPDKIVLWDGDKTKTVLLEACGLEEYVGKTDELLGFTVTYTYKDGVLAEKKTLKGEKFDNVTLTWATAKSEDYPTYVSGTTYWFADRMNVNGTLYEGENFSNLRAVVVDDNGMFTVIDSNYVSSGEIGGIKRFYKYPEIEGISWDPRDADNRNALGVEYAFLGYNFSYEKRCCGVDSDGDGAIDFLFYKSLMPYRVTDVVDAVDENGSYQLVTIESIVVSKSPDKAIDSRKIKIPSGSLKEGDVFVGI
ncbi:MAG: leucine-rich repeat domain-containing protein, partial [Clostridia bacterium]|nr:leucine-rich repeat domain-containing protein [Clostridia bacterium]